MADKNYKGLVELHDKLKSRPFEILAFPCNQFGGQEPGSRVEIRSFAKGYGVLFRLMDKIDVNGFGAHPAYQLLKGPGGDDIRWNYFSKFVVRCHAEECEIHRFDGAPEPLKLEPDIRRLLDSLKGSGGGDL
mmetsp:Transcript_66787/g.175093  ORF Transcript_66787/g.175093 Transcript_66787/m.175093 type:complete len:132 (+) Transcript_66787:235-630(+)